MNSSVWQQPSISIKTSLSESHHTCGQPNENHQRRPGRPLVDIFELHWYMQASPAEFCLSLQTSIHVHMALRGPTATAPTTPSPSLSEADHLVWCMDKVWAQELNVFGKATPPGASVTTPCTQGVGFDAFPSNTIKTNTSLPSLPLKSLVPELLWISEFFFSDP